MAHSDFSSLKAEIKKQFGVTINVPELKKMDLQGNSSNYCDDLNLYSWEMRQGHVFHYEHGDFVPLEVLVRKNPELKERINSSK